MPSSGDTETINSLAHLLAGTVARLTEVIQKGRYDRVFFLSREGLVFYRALLASSYPGQLSTPLSYLLASRRSLSLATCCTLLDCYRLLDIPFYPQTLQSLLSSRYGVGLPAGSYNPVVSRHDKEIIRRQIKKQRGEILKAANEERRGYTAYLLSKRMSPHGRYLLVDVGYNGTFHRAFEKLAPGAEFESFCLAAFTGAADLVASGKMHLVFEGIRNNQLKNDPISRNVACLEVLLMAPHPSFLSVALNCDRELEFRFEANAYSATASVQKLQNEALRLIPLASTVPWRQAVSVFEEWVKKPSRDSVFALSGLQLDDSFGGERLRPLIASDSLLKEMSSFEDAVTLVERSGWRDGALTLLRFCIVAPPLAAPVHTISLAHKLQKRIKKVTKSRAAFLRHLQITFLKLVGLYKVPRTAYMDVADMAFNQRSQK